MEWGTSRTARRERQRERPGWPGWGRTSTASGTPYIFLADWNALASSLEAEGWLEEIGAVVVKAEGGVATCTVGTGR